MSTYHEDRPRLAAQTAAIVERLRHGPARNTELAAFALKYTSRISDARLAGYVIHCERQIGGVTIYTLVREPGQAPVQLELPGAA